MSCVAFPQIGRCVEVGDGETILQAALAAGLAYPHRCRAGRCGACKSLVIAGHVELGQHSAFALTRAEREAGLILACRAVPVGDVTVAWIETDDPASEKP